MNPRVPKLRQHPNGQAFVEHRSIPTKSRRLYLGKAGSPEALKRYGEFVQQVLAGGYSRPIDPGARDDATVDELILAYLVHAEGYYGAGSKELGHFVKALEHFSALFGSTPGREIGPGKLTAMQKRLVGVGLSRGFINAQVGRIRRFVRWCCSNERLPAELFHKLLCVEGLKAGKCEARETDPVTPVSKAVVQATLPHLPPIIRAMVQVQYLCGMRPEEVVIMRGCDLRTAGPVWLYMPSRHKNAWRGKRLVKAVPAAAQAILRPLLSTDLQAFLFNPRSSEERRTGRRARPQVRQSYDVYTYRRAITRACEKAFGMPAELRRAKSEEMLGKASEWRAANCWSPNQLRHSIATELRQTIGQQAAQCWLGHESADTTEIYAEKQIAELIALAQELDRRWAG